LPGLFINAQPCAAEFCSRESPPPALDDFSKAIRETSVPRYFFNIYHDKQTRDFEGLNCRTHMLRGRKPRLLPAKLSKLDGSLRPGHDWRMEMTDKFANPLGDICVKAKKIDRGVLDSSTPETAARELLRIYNVRPAGGTPDTYTGVTIAKFLQGPRPPLGLVQNRRKRYASACLFIRRELP
jgi:hypothetical protein